PHLLGVPDAVQHLVFDPRLVAIAGELAAACGRSEDGYEHQMLYGIRDAEQVRLAAEGKRVRVYVPYGTEWYGYYMRRLAERPANVLFLARSLATRNGAGPLLNGDLVLRTRPAGHTV